MKPYKNQPDPSADKFFFFKRGLSMVLLGEVACF